MGRTYRIAWVLPVRPKIGRAEFERCWPWLLASLHAYFQTHREDQIWEGLQPARPIFGPARIAPSVCAWLRLENQGGVPDYHRLG
jgi:hypothetical protein